MINVLNMNLITSLVAKGLKFDDLTTLTTEELIQLDSDYKVTFVKNPRTWLEENVAAMASNNEYHRVMEIEGGNDLLRAVNDYSSESTTRWGLAQLDNSPALFKAACTVLSNKVQKVRARLNERTALSTLRLTNRSEYLPVIDLVYSLMKSGKELNISFEKGLAATGILSRALEALGHKTQGVPLQLRIVNNLPYKKNMKGELTSEQHAIPAEEWDILRAHNWLPTQGNLAWNWGNHALKDLLLKCFPLAIDLGAYGHRLSSPLIPGGFLENVTVRFSNPQGFVPDRGEFAAGVQESLAEQLDLLTDEEKTIYTMADMECDGSGLYDPDHPVMNGLVLRYGKVPFQLTVLRTDGLFAKGIIVPRQNLCEFSGYAEPIHMDMAQVKGSHKGKWSEGDIAENCFIGIMKSWTKSSFFPGCFELLEFITPNKEMSKNEIGAILSSLVEEAVDTIAKSGVEGLMREISRDDDNLKLIVKFCTQMKAQGLEIDPLSIPLLKSAIDDKLQAKLWVLQQGAGISGKQYVTVLDATVPEGHVVLPGFKIGTEVAIWRFPAVLPQGLVLAVVDAPRPHHMVHDGRVVQQVEETMTDGVWCAEHGHGDIVKEESWGSSIVREWTDNEGKRRRIREIVVQEGRAVPIENAVFMNPRDLTSRMQGDDDGDIVGVSNDPRVRELFRARASQVVYEIEPQGGKFTHGSDSPEGHKYLETDPRGPVGMTTIWQAQLLAVGDMWGALAMGVLNQEAIDAAKRKIAWTDVRKASQSGSWFMNEKGNKALLPAAKLSEDEYENDPTQPIGWPGQMTKAWVVERLNKFGCIQNDKVWMNPLSWRTQHTIKDGKVIKLSKRVHGEHWVGTKAKDKGWGGGNTVHQCADIAMDLWKSKSGQWNALGLEGENKTTTNVRDLLGTLMVNAGAPTTLQAHTWEEYMELRSRTIYSGETDEYGTPQQVGYSIEEYGREFRKLLSTSAGKEDDDKKFVGIENLTQQLNMWFSHLSVADLATIYYWENTPTYKVVNNKSVSYTHVRPADAKYAVNKPNYGFKAVCWPGSPFLPLLNIADAQGCDFLSVDKRLAKVTKWGAAQADPFVALNAWQFRDQKHGAAKVDEDGQRIEMHQCRTCMEAAHTSLVRNWRNSKTKGEIKYMINLISELKKPRCRPWAHVEADMGADELGNVQEEYYFEHECMDQ